MSRVLSLVKLQYRFLENASKHPWLDSAEYHRSGYSGSPVVHLLSFFDSAFPLTPEVQKFKNVIENRVQRELAEDRDSLAQVGQDKFLKLF